MKLDGNRRKKTKTTPAFHQNTNNFPRLMSLSQQRPTTALSSVHFRAKLICRTLLGLQLQSPTHAQGKGRRKEYELLEYKLQNNQLLLREGKDSAEALEGMTLEFKQLY